MEPLHSISNLRKGHIFPDYSETVGPNLCLDAMNKKVEKFPQKGWLPHQSSHILLWDSVIHIFVTCKEALTSAIDVCRGVYACVFALRVHIKISKTLEGAGFSL